jgi:hypothetical protein
MDTAERLLHCEGHMKKPVCRHCHHPAHRADCGVDDCGCVKYVPLDLAAKAAKQALWVGQVSFLLKKGWTRTCEVRVKAQGQSGAAMKAVREAKSLAVTSRARVDQVKLTLIRVPASATASAAAKPLTRPRGASR